VLVIGLALLAIAALPHTAGARAPDRVCGIEPGEGAFNYYEVWGMSCARAEKVSDRAGRKFCGPRFGRCDAEPGEFDSGRVKVGRWKCKMRVGYESYRARCFQRRGEEPRFVHRSGA
jgi:hypothetical protein